MNGRTLVRSVLLVGMHSEKAPHTVTGTVYGAEFRGLRQLSHRSHVLLTHKSGFFSSEYASQATWTSESQVVVERVLFPR